FDSKKSSRDDAGIGRGLSRPEGEGGPDGQAGRASGESGTVGGCQVQRREVGCERCGREDGQEILRLEPSPPPRTKEHSRVARINAFEIFWRGVLPVEADSGESRCSRRRMGGSEVFVSASYRHDSAWKSRGLEPPAWICDLGLFQAIPSKNRAPKSTLASREFFYF